jgi:apolipoprotein N-acyltransferase
MDVDPDDNDIAQRLLAHSICAGTSALILSIAHIHPEYWFISFFALIPFLWRLKRASLFGSILLGFILAVCYAFVALTGEAVAAPWTFLLNLLLLSLVFSTFGMAVNRIKRYIGFSPVFIAAFWLPLEYVLTHYTALGSIFSFSREGSGFVVRFGSLFGFLMISFGIVFINSLILVLIEHMSRWVASNVSFGFAEEKKYYLVFQTIAPARRRCYFSEPRAPPTPITASCF